MKTLLASITIAISVLSLAGCKLFEDSEAVKVGLFISKSGNDVKYGESVERGIQLAIEHANENESLKNLNIKLVTVETNGQKSQIEKTVERFASDENIVAILGEVSSERSNWAAKIAQKHRLPMVSPAATNPNVTENGNYIFRACYIDPFQGYAMAQFAFSELRLKRIAVLRHNHSNYALGLSEYFIERFRKLGGRIVAEEEYSTTQGTLNFQEALPSLRKAQPEAIYIPAYYSDAATLSQALRKAKIKSVLLGGDGWDSPEISNLGGKDVIGTYFTTHFSHEATNPIARAFVEKFKAKFGIDPDGTAATGYDAANMVINAIHKSTQQKKLSRRQVREELAHIKNFSGVTGLITIDEDGNPRKSVVVLRIEKNDFQYVKTITPAQNPQN